MPTAKLADRFGRLWPLIVSALPHCHRTVFHDNASDNGPIEIASYRYGLADYSPRWPTWTPAVLLALPAT